METNRSGVSGVPTDPSVGASASRGRCRNGPQGYLLGEWPCGLGVAVGEAIGARTIALGVYRRVEVPTMLWPRLAPLPRHCRGVEAGLVV